MKKRKYTLLLIITMALSFCIGNNTVYALTDNSDVNSSNLEYILKNAGPDNVYLEDGVLKYSDEYINSMKEKNNQLEESNRKYMETKKFNISDNGLVPYALKGEMSPQGFCYNSRTLNVPTYQQEKYYWCGPAAVKETLQFLNGNSLSQTQYANHMETDIDGSTWVYKLTNELNNQQSRHNYQFEDVRTVDRFRQILIADVMDSEVGVPFILHALTGPLYTYNNNTIHHYLVVMGGNMPNQTVTYVDSYSYDYGRGTTLGRHTDSLNSVASTVTTNERYVIW